LHASTLLLSYPCASSSSTLSTAKLRKSISAYCLSIKSFGPLKNKNEFRLSLPLPFRHPPKSAFKSVSKKERPILPGTSGDAWDIDSDLDSLLSSSPTHPHPHRHRLDESMETPLWTSPKDLDEDSSSSPGSFKGDGAGSEDHLVDDTIERTKTRWIILALACFLLFGVNVFPSSL